MSDTTTTRRKAKAICEYKILCIHDTISQIEAQINALAKDGWEIQAKSIRPAVNMSTFTGMARREVKQ